MAPILSLPCIAIDGLRPEEANELAAVSLECSVCEGVELSPSEADVRVGLEGVVPVVSVCRRVMISHIRKRVI